MGSPAVDRTKGRIVLGIVSGIVLAYCLLSTMCFTMGWISRPDMLVNCIVFLAALITAGVVGYRRRRDAYHKRLLLRASILLAAVIIIALVPFPQLNPAH
jgi:hypothetical protein